MRSRLNDIPILKTIHSHMEASYYNQVCKALQRLGNPLRIELINLRGLDILIDNEAWVCVDRTMSDLPALAWTAFKPNQREGLHLPVPCELRFYHNHADLICGTVLDLVDRNISERLKSLSPVQPQPVSQLRPRRR